MAKRLTFNEFRTAIDQRTMPLEKLPDYVDFDPQSPIPKLVFRADALIDQPPPDYDVDAEIYRMLRIISEERDARLETFAFVGQKRVVAEGDSWFNLPVLIRPPAIADWIERNGRFRMRNIAYWGHTLERILRDQEYMKVLAQEKPEYFMFSAGGNDLQLGLANGSYVYTYDPARPLDQYLTKEGEAALVQIEKGYKTLLAELLQFPALKIICYGYDYPRPLVKGGTYIGQYLRKKGIPNHLMGPIIASIIDKLNEVIKRATQSTTAQYLDCRGVTEPYTWYDDMHPDRDGFLALAVKFEEAMSRL
ncbi:SGNH/GDSL hydrolase family protein [Leptodesmis sichuanensis]|uniref:SGNH/GDSL hydrolase family protein n=1 Tax=Leptodesmis sichuanensis TaxID=2906798 RepID=UPI001F2F56CF|nr:SGNH/GDSL hydrolase family protein [Leptodesmis sichuanensis]UIE35952.1 SGNH/GDSL hydrolase family protein [Leptodesmis sichuanensis A121]